MKLKRLSLVLMACVVSSTALIACNEGGGANGSALNSAAQGLQQTNFSIYNPTFLQTNKRQYLPSDYMAIGSVYVVESTVLTKMRPDLPGENKLTPKSMVLTSDNPDIIKVSTTPNAQTGKISYTLEPLKLGTANLSLQVVLPDGESGTVKFQRIISNSAPIESVSFIENDGSKFEGSKVIDDKTYITPMLEVGSSHTLDYVRVTDSRGFGLPYSIRDIKVTTNSNNAIKLTAKTSETGKRYYAADILNEGVITLDVTATNGMEFKHTFQSVNPAQTRGLNIKVNNYSDLESDVFLGTSYFLDRLTYTDVNGNRSFYSPADIKNVISSDPDIISVDRMKEISKNAESTFMLQTHKPGNAIIRISTNNGQEFFRTLYVGRGAHNIPNLDKLAQMNVVFPIPGDVDPKSVTFTPRKVYDTTDAKIDWDHKDFDAGLISYNDFNSMHQSTAVSRVLVPGGKYAIEANDIIKVTMENYKEWEMGVNNPLVAKNAEAWGKNYVKIKRPLAWGYNQWSVPMVAAFDCRNTYGSQGLLAEQGRSEFAKGVSCGNNGSWDTAWFNDFIIGSTYATKLYIPFDLTIADSFDNNANRFMAWNVRAVHKAVWVNESTDRNGNKIQQLRGDRYGHQDKPSDDHAAFISYFNNNSGYSNEDPLGAFKVNINSPTEMQLY